MKNHVVQVLSVETSDIFMHYPCAACCEHRKKNTYKNFIVWEIREQTVLVTEIIYIFASYFSTSLSKQTCNYTVLFYKDVLQIEKNSSKFLSSKEYLV